MAIEIKVAHPIAALGVILAEALDATKKAMTETRALAAVVVAVSMTAVATSR